MESDRYTPFARWLRALLQSRGMSQSEFARRLERPRETVARWLTTQNPNEENCDRIAIVLDVPIGEVLTLAGHQVPRDSMGETKDRLIELINVIPSTSLEVYIPIFEQLAGVRGKAE